MVTATCPAGGLGQARTIREPLDMRAISANCMCQGSNHARHAVYRCWLELSATPLSAWPWLLGLVGTLALSIVAPARRQQLLMICTLQQAMQELCFIYYCSRRHEEARLHEQLRWHVDAEYLSASIQLLHGRRLRVVWHSRSLKSKAAFSLTHAFKVSVD